MEKLDPYTYYVLRLQYWKQQVTQSKLMCLFMFALCIFWLVAQGNHWEIGAGIGFILGCIHLAAWYFCQKQVDDFTKRLEGEVHK